ncbi:MAG: HD-GYP domain-containing protein [Elusimicrobia bacterium CG08_land_8_20_14_0_20_44_26]|nr:MAG: HD-GYP domain-containing protein [Elusimicrobia bacterium CG08_land_8_20_14_0_20_44_26]
MKKLNKVKKVKKVISSTPAKQLGELVKLVENMHEYNVLSHNISKTAQLYDLIVTEATDIMDTRIGSLMLFNRARCKLEIVASRGLSREVVKITSLKPGEGIAGKVFESGRSIFCEDIEKDTRFKKESRIKYYSKSFVSVPLKVNGRIIGVLNVNNRKSRKPFTVEALNILNVIADEAAMIIENRHLLRSLENAYVDTIATLAKALDERMPATKGHSSRVADLSYRLARRLGFREDRLHSIRNAALIHDIGKISIPDEILLKPAALSASERKIIQKHPEKGSGVISKSDYFKDFLPIIAFHHEWYNGKGYPLGLKGSQIPLSARIVSVCDAWDAMISKRPYREPLSKRDAVKEILRFAGSQFDPRVVKEFLKMSRR